jgi:transcription elongation factor Elf1
MTKKYTHESKGVNCPECGEVTHELFNVKSKTGQGVLLCDACKPDIPKKIQEGWYRGGINE